jgi:hypothetical protein
MGRTWGEIERCLGYRRKELQRLFRSRSMADPQAQATGPLAVDVIAALVDEGATAQEIAAVLREYGGLRQRMRVA